MLVSPVRLIDVLMSFDDVPETDENSLSDILKTGNTTRVNRSGLICFGVFVKFMEACFGVLVFIPKKFAVKTTRTH